MTFQKLLNDFRSNFYSTFPRSLALANTGIFLICFIKICKINKSFIVFSDFASLQEKKTIAKIRNYYAAPYKSEITLSIVCDILEANIINNTGL